MSTNLYPANEIVGAMAGSMASAEQIAIFAKDPKAVLTSQLNVETEATFSVVENSADTVHLSLPYYSEIEELHAKMLADDSIEDVAGGEIIVGGTMIVIGLITGSVTASIIGTIAVGTVVGTGVVAGIAVGVTKPHEDEGK